ncbi:HYR-like domain-containing protein, partial [Flavobacterium suzhouense]
NCGGTITYTKTSGEFTRGDCDNSGTYTNTWVAKDVCNNTSSVFTQVITIEDTQVPVWSTAASSLNITLQCSDSEGLANAQSQAPVATDNCGGVITYTKTSGEFTRGDCDNSGTYTNTWTATDGCNNTSLVFTQIITIDDTQVPVWSTESVALNVTLECSDASGLANAQAQAPVATDNCGGIITYTKTSGEFTRGDCDNSGTYTNTWTATDVCGNVSEVFTQIIIIEDTQVPVWSTESVALNVTLECSDASGLANAQSQAPVATDNCDGTITYTKTSGSFVAGACANSGTYTNTWTAADGCNNTSLVFTQVITIEDTQVPVWSTAASSLNVTLQCNDASGLATAQSQAPVATDNCGGVITYTKTSGEFTRGDCDNSGTYTNTWTATDVCGNVSEVFTQIITIEDTQVPVWSTESVALNVTLECSDASGLANAQSQAPVATDNCGGIITYTKTSGSFVAGACANSGTYTNTWTATDGCNNTSLVFTQVITIEDTQVPVWSTTVSSLNITLQCSDVSGLAAAQAQAPVATDNCGGVITYTKTSGSFVAGSCANAGTYTNTWVAKDACNNTSSVFTQVITIEDTQVPVWSTEASALNVTLQCSDASGLATAQSQAPVATDNCGGTITYTKTSGSFIAGSCANSGTYTNTWLAKDVCNNTSSVFTQVITIEDTQVPVWSTEASALNVTLQCSDASGLATAQSQAPFATDNCGGTITYTKTSGSFIAGACANSGTYTNTWTATDGCNNTSLIFTQVITIEDTQVPVWSTESVALNVTLECSDVEGLATAQSQAPVATDNCGGTITYTKTSGSFVAGACANSGTYTNTWTATDGCNNTSSVFTQVITIEDTQVPVWSTESVALNVTLECSDVEGLATAQSQAPVATDNCGGTITYTKTSGSFIAGACANAGSYTNTWTATDGCNNASLVFTQVITIEDTQVPVWSTEASTLNVTLQCSDSEGLSNAQSQSPVATDNCGGTITYTKTSGSFVEGLFLNEGTYTNTWTATDICSNSSSVFTQTITIVDTLVPVVTTSAFALNITLQCSDALGLAAAQLYEPEAVDNCGGAVSFTKTSGTFVQSECENSGTYTNTWVALDLRRNASSVFTQIITIEDTQAPIWSTEASSLNITLQCSDASGFAAAQAQSPVAIDNCGGAVSYNRSSGEFIRGDCDNSGTYTNTWVATDGCGNVSEIFTQIITIEDTQVPVWSTTASSLNVTLQCSDASGLATAQSQAPVATDNCGDTITYTKTSGSFIAGSCANAGTYTNTWIATDVCGNISEIFTQIITIEDTQVP